MIGAAFLASGLALAGGGQSGSSGFFSVPTADTVVVGGAQVSGGISTGQVGGIPGISVLPVGAAFGLSRRTEVGIRIAPEAWKPVEQRLDGAYAVGMHARVRVQDPQHDRLGWAFHAEFERSHAALPVRLGAIAHRERGRLTVAVAGGPRWDGAGAFGGWLGAGAESRLDDRVALLSDVSVTGAFRRGGIFDYRAGARITPDGPSDFTAWVGGGNYEGTPWAAVGVYITLRSGELTGLDRDRDKVEDRLDACRWDAEDLDGWEDTDGCPDFDNDADGIPDAEDPTPNGEAEAESIDEWPEFESVSPELKIRIQGRKVNGPSSPDARGGATETQTGSSGGR